MLVLKSNFDTFLSAITEENFIGFDTETFGLWWWDSPHPVPKPGIFAVQFATNMENFYLDFHHTESKLTQTHWDILQRELFSNPDITWAIQNAKFDMHQSANYGIDIAGTIHCTKAIARIVDNLEAKINLDVLSEKYLGYKKFELPEIPKTKIKKWGKNEKFEEFLHFDQLPLTTLIEYGERDTELARKLAYFQCKKIAEIDEQIYLKFPNRRFSLLSDLVKSERKLTKVLFQMERTGVKIDRSYCEKAYEHECAQYEELKKELDSIAGQQVDWLSPKQLKPIFDKLEQPYSYTEKGNASFDKEALERSDAPIAKLIIKYRYHYKRAHTYFENFIWLADSKDILHCDFQQGGPETGRMSCWNPNLQNVPKRADKQEKEFPVRRCFIPREGTRFVDIDYKAAEYCMMFDYAGETEIIEQIKNGMDPHEATLKQMPNLKDRDEAKTMNFRVLYSAGHANIGYALGAKTDWEATKMGKEAKTMYFAKLGGIKRFIFNVRDAANLRGFVINWAGRLLKYDRNTSYKAPNGLIQGGVGDMAKEALNRIQAVIKGNGLQSRLILQVHDAVLLEVPDNEKEFVDVACISMKNIYPHKTLPIDVDAKFSKKSWGDLVDKWEAT